MMPEKGLVDEARETLRSVGTASDLLMSIWAHIFQKPGDISMANIKGRVLAIVSGVAILAAPLSAYASYSGVAFCNVSTAVSSNAPTSSTLAAGEATGTECATFSASAIDFSAGTVSGQPTNPYTLAGFLTGNGSVIGSVTFLNGFTGASSPNNALFVFTGTASFTNGQSFNVQHDDGTNMYVNGALVLGAPGPTPPIISSFTYSGASGNLPFEFIFAECCGAPSVFATTLVPPTTVPEPGSLALFGSGLLGLYGVARRRMGFLRK